MIHVERGREPPDLAPARARGLSHLRGVRVTRQPVSADFDLVPLPDSVRTTLWSAQHHKCCYCERLMEAPFNDDEHFRPKTSAARSPGSIDTAGYWWLAYTWENLLFACNVCNRTGKNDLFPLALGSSVLQPEQAPPGDERPLLLDPAGRLNPVEHIEFVYRCEHPGGRKRWYADPRDGSELGLYTLQVLGLNRDGLLDLRDGYVTQHIRPGAERLLCELDELDERRRRGAPVERGLRRAEDRFAEAMRFLAPEFAHVALAYDALRHLVPEARLQSIARRWPSPGEVVPPPRRALRRSRPQVVDPG